MTEGKLYWQMRGRTDVRKDWDRQSTDWLEDYWNSRNHPHRQAILNAIIDQPDSVLEIGCNVGPNLSLIQDKLHPKYMAGVDVNEPAIREAEVRLPNVELHVTGADSLPFPDRHFDLILLDAVLMYVDYKSIKSVIREIDRVTKKNIIIVDWYYRWANGGVVRDGHWARAYDRIFRQRGFKASRRKLTNQEWPTRAWQKHGYLFTLVRQ